MYNKVLLYLDYATEGAAAEVALRLAEEHEAELLVLIAPPLPPPFPYQNPHSYEAERDKLRASQIGVLMAASHRGVICIADWVRSASARTILDRAMRGGCDLIVIAAREPGLWGALFGTLPERLARAGECPILVVGSEDERVDASDPAAFDMDSTHLVALKSELRYND